MEKFKLMDMEWSIVEEDGEFLIHVKIPSSDETEYDFTLDEAEKLSHNIDQLIYKAHYKEGKIEKEKEIKGKRLELVTVVIDGDTIRAKHPNPKVRQRVG